MTCPILFRNYRVILNKAINVPFKKNILFCNLSQPNWVNGKRFLNNTTSNTAQPISHTAEEIGQVADHIPYEKIRNMGMIAHIDAGKTTTTERMLYYAGYTHQIGDVDSGTTITDYLPSERARGITITSASIPLLWSNHLINLIDTPGHVDFTIEVERSIRVLDGAVVIIDGVAGIEAQTEVVWGQAARNNVAKLIFINKMDREGSNIQHVIKNVSNSTRARLRGQGKGVLIQWPLIKEEDNSNTGYSGGGNSGQGGNGFCGVVDLVTMNVLEWNPNHQQTGAVIQQSPLTVSKYGMDLYEKSQKARETMIENLTEADDEFLEEFLKLDMDSSQLKPEIIKSALRRATIAHKITPILCGASFKNVGVQPLMDSILDYLPSPGEKKVIGNKIKSIQSSKSKKSVDKIKKMETAEETVIDINDKNLVALAFKVMQDPRRGALVYVRVYSGVLHARSIVLNSSRKEKERIVKLLQPYGGSLQEVPNISAGHIGVIVGLTHTCTGDTLISTSSHSSIILPSIPIPPPVFVCSVEPHSAKDVKNMKDALAIMVREDPSLKVWGDDESGQICLAGMGELHLEITGERLRDIGGVKAKFGKIRINYRETMIPNTMEGGNVIERNLFGKRSKVGIWMKIEKFSQLQDGVDSGDFIPVAEHGDHGNEIVLDEVENFNDENALPLSSGYPTEEEIIKSLRGGLNSALSRGPILGFPLSGLRIILQKIEFFGPELTTTQALRSVAMKILQDLLRSDGICNVIEPMALLTVNIPEKFMGIVTKDLSGRRRGEILSLDEETSLLPSSSSSSSSSLSDDNENSEISATNSSRKIIQAKVPLSELIGYASIVRGLTAGNAQVRFDVVGYRMMSKDRIDHLRQEIRGF